MKERQPSRTALGAAGYRAAHQQLEGGKVFSDPLARTILGDGADAIIAGLSADPAQQRMRIFIAARSRFAEDSLAVAVSRGVRQAVVSIVRRVGVELDAHHGETVRRSASARSSVHAGGVRDAGPPPWCRITASVVRPVSGSIHEPAQVPAASVTSNVPEARPPAPAPVAPRGAWRRR